MEAREVVAEQVKVRRQQLGWNQGELSEALAGHGMNIDRSGVVRLEAGRRGIRVEDLLALAAALQTTPTDLLAPMHSRTVSVGDSQLTAAQLVSWCHGDPDAWRRRRISLADLRARAEGQRLIEDLVDTVTMMSEAIEDRDRAAVIFAAGRAHNALAAASEWTFTEDEHRELARRWELIGQED